MTKEEKAKAYDEALERAREIKEKIVYSHISSESCKAVSEYIDTIIPELAESEDERIRKQCIKLIREAYSTKYEALECLAWLEKRKEQKPSESISQTTVQGKGVYKICPHCKSRMIRDDSKVYTSMPPQYGYNCPKCGTMEFDTAMYDSPEIEEQKPAECIEDSVKFEEGFKTGREVGFREGVESVKIAEWSVEDKDYYDAIIAKLEITQDDALLTDNQMNFLKALRHQPKQEWSEEDEKLLSKVEALLDDYCDYLEDASSHFIPEVRETISRLKSLRLQLHCKSSKTQLCAPVSTDDAKKFGQLEYERGVKDGLNQHWKPSEEQMEALLKLEETHVLEHERTQETARLYMVIKGLREQLLKLRRGEDNAKPQENCLSNSKKLM